MIRTAAMLTILLAPAVSAADGPPWLRDLAGDRDLPRPWGVGFDFYTMDQDYSVADLQFTLPGAELPDPSQIGVTNEIQHMDLKADVWLLPFLNVFGLLGYVQSDTTVDLSGTEVIGLPVTLGRLPIDTDGTVWGVGATLAFGGESWFGAVTTTWTDADLTGDFDSSAETLAVQPRIGLIRGAWTAWVGAMYLDIEEKHSGSIALPGLGAVPFAVVLESRDEWNQAIGVGHEFSDRASLSFELGFGDRDHTLFNYTFRF